MNALDWSGNTVVVSAITGSYDSIKKHVYSEGVDYILYSDTPEHEIDSRWEVIELENPNKLSPRILAKSVKLYPHQYERLLQYKYMIWIDGSINIVNQNFIPEVLSFLKNDIVLSPHFEPRICAYEEAEVCLGSPILRSNAIINQVKHYRSEGFPENYGLYACGLFARDMGSEIVKEIGRKWFQENVKWSSRDQISLPYILWKTGFKPSMLPKEFRQFEWVTMSPHN